MRMRGAEASASSKQVAVVFRHVVRAGREAALPEEDRCTSRRKLVPEKMPRYRVPRAAPGLGRQDAPQLRHDAGQVQV